MSDYTRVRIEGLVVQQRSVDLEVQHQALRAYADQDGLAWTREDRLQGLDSYSARYRAEIASWFADLPELFDELAQLPDPVGLRSEADALAAALGPLAGPTGHLDPGDGRAHPPHPAYDRLDDLPRLMADWTGAAADAFATTFVPPLRRVVHHEFEAVATLRSALLAEAALWTQARADVVSLIRETSAALDDYESGQDAPALADLDHPGPVVAVASAPYDGDGDGALSWRVPGAADLVAAVVLERPSSRDRPVVQGDSPAQVIASMRRCVEDLKARWVAAEEFVAEQLRALQDRMYGYLAGDHVYHRGVLQSFTLPRPALADAPAGRARERDNFGIPSPRGTS